MSCISAVDKYLHMIYMFTLNGGVVLTQKNKQSVDFSQSLLTVEIWKFDGNSKLQPIQINEK